MTASQSFSRRQVLSWSAAAVGAASLPVQAQSPTKIVSTPQRLSRADIVESYAVSIVIFSPSARIESKLEIVIGLSPCK